MTEIQCEIEELSTYDGKKISLRHWSSAEQSAEPVAIVQLVHGLAEHIGRYQHFAETLVRRGFQVYGHDHRGHGLSVDSEANLGFFDESYGWRKVVEDLKIVNEKIQNTHYDVPLILFGHSMGSFATQYALTKYPNLAQGVILSGSTFPNTLLVKLANVLAKYEKNKSGPTARCQSVDYLTFTPYNKKFHPNRTPCDWLSRDESEVDAYVADQKCGFVATSQLWIDLSTALLNLYSRKNHTKLPTNIPYCLIAGDKDPVGSSGRGVKKLEKRLKKYGIDVYMHLYRGGRHEMLNETNRDEVENDIITWIKHKVVTQCHNQRDQAREKLNKKR